MVSHDTFKNIVLFSLVIAFLYFLFRDKIQMLIEEPMTSQVMNDTSSVNTHTTNPATASAGVMTSENTGIDRSMIISDDEIGILSTCRDNKGHLIENCSPVSNYNYEYDKSYDSYLRKGVI